MMNPVGKVKEEVRGTLGFVRHYWLGALVFGVVFAVLVFPRVATLLGKLKAKDGVWKYIPSFLTRV